MSKVLGWRLYELMRDIQRKEDWDNPLEENIEELKEEIWNHFNLGVK